MPTLSIYVSDELYLFLSTLGKPSKIGKEWVEERYEHELGDKK